MMMGLKTRTHGDLLLRSLEDLKKWEFRKFKDKLSDLPHSYKCSISRGLLEDADFILTKNLMINIYGEEEALHVALQVFKMINLMGPAEELQLKMSQKGKLGELNRHEDIKREWRAQYMKLMRNEYKCIEENNSRMGETVSLEKRYTNLLLINGHQDEEDRKNALSSTGRSHIEIMNIRTSNKYSSITTQSLFEPNEDGLIPTTVVLVGPAGIGKTMTTQKIMLQWASGHLFGDKFDYVFHVSCREINILKGVKNIAGLISKTCKMSFSNDLALSILSDCRKILFIFDGFDELRWSMENDQESYVCDDDPFEEAHRETLIKSLLMKQIVKEASLIITTRPFALEKLKNFIKRPRYVEVLGFTGQDRQEYFSRFFQNEELAAKALNVIKENEIIYTMCAIPIICWIVCTVLKPKIKQDLKLSDYNTATSIYLLYLKGLIKYHGRNQPITPCLKKLCSLANEGVLNRKIMFDEGDLKRHGIEISEVESVFLNENIFYREIETQTFYSFIHLSVQEFFAALHYGFVEEIKEETFLPEICKGNSLLEQCRHRPHLTLTIRFLVGLSSAKCPKETLSNLGCSLQVTTAMELWFTGDNPSRFCTEAIYCLYETQDSDLLKRLMTRSSDIVFEHSWYWSNNYNKELTYCIKHCSWVSSLTFLNYKLDSKEQVEFFNLLMRFSMLCFSKCQFANLEDSDPEEEQISFLLRLSDQQSRIQELRFNESFLPTPLCNDLHMLVRSQSLTKLCLTWRALLPSGVKYLCEGLRHPSCTLQELSLAGCRLVPSSCEDLSSVISTNHSLKKMDLSCNFLGDSGVKFLCEGLKHPGCTLQKLRLSECELTSSCCDDLCSVLMTNQFLTKLDLSNNSLQDGVKLLCKGLRHPGCPLQKLRLWGCNLESSCCEDLHSVIITNSTLIKMEVSMYICEEQTESELQELCERFSSLACVSEKKNSFYRSELTLKYRKHEKILHNLQ
ncbi:NACHT, LRR and PYD domains-containing protein 3-like isoform X1 [Dendrobates tinctorius]|uniref:NACHT, LRR and PYD domains-containing protein 3-like isoform X1 n=1 Tax=Dendrobates tinctorius TaxID=92724 RepID=UPI003CC93834